MPDSDCRNVREIRTKKAADSIEKLNISIEKANIFIEKLNISIEKTNISIEKLIIFIKKLNISIEKLIISIEKGTKTRKKRGYFGDEVSIFTGFLRT